MFRLTVCVPGLHGLFNCVCVPGLHVLFARVVPGLIGLVNTTNFGILESPANMYIIGPFRLRFRRYFSSYHNLKNVPGLHG